MLRLKITLLLYVALAGSSVAGEYLGNLSGNPFVGDGARNPFAPINNPFNANSLTNRFGPYGNRFSGYSPNNPFSTEGPEVYGTMDDID